MKVIPLTRGCYAKISDEDFDKVSKYTWHTVIPSGRQDGKKYAETSFRMSGKKFNVYMHRFILEVTDRLTQVDHVDADGLNNQRNNIRLATPSQNLMARILTRRSQHGFRGVGKLSTNRFGAHIGVENKSQYLGCFLTAEEAAQAYDRAALQLYGEFAVLNFA